jgi:protein O-GlcNAc transferase
MRTIPEKLALALQLHQAGNFQQAETIYLQILQMDPRHAEALNYLGLIAQQVGQSALAVDYLQRSVAIEPSNPRYHANLGLAYQALGNLDRATSSCREALRLQPDFCDAHNNLANALSQQGKLDEAVASYHRALAINPNHAAIHYNLAAALASLGMVDEAAASYRQALLLNPNYLKAHLNLGILDLDQARPQQAIDHFQHCLRLDPRYVPALHNLGNALKKQGRLEEAAANYRMALVVQADCAEAIFSLGNVFLEQNKQEEAIACFRQVLSLRPDRPETLAAANDSLAIALGQQGKSSEALACFKQALRLQPTAWRRISLAVHLPVIYQSLDDLHAWRNRLVQEIRLLREQEVVHDLADKPAPLLFHLAYQGFNDRDLEREFAQLFRVPAEAAGSRAAAAAPEPRKIRIGFISAHFKTHTIGHWMRGLIAHLARDDFEILVLSIGSHDDEIGAFIKNHADRYLEIPSNLRLARRLIAEQGLDVLFYADIGMEPIASSLAFSRLAPVQCVTLGHPVTTGLGSINYFISAEGMEAADAEQHYTETLVRLKVPPFYLYRPELPASLHPRGHFGLTDRDHVYVCLQYPFKFHPEFDEILGGILRGDPQGKLLLSSWMPWEQLLRERFSQTLPDVLDRIRFLPRLHYPDYLNLLTLANVQLDPLHFGGGSTSYEALALGLPIVTLPKQLLRGRITASFYKQMHVLDCIAQSPSDYIQIALRLGTDPSYRQSIRAKILPANDVLFENSEGIRELERFIKTAVQEARA